MADAKNGLCEFCRELRPVAHVDAVGREFCAQCLDQLTDTLAFTPMDYLLITIPFQVGDRVECRTAGALYDGIGVIDEVSMDLAKFGTPVFPSFHVKMVEKAYPEAPDELWYLEQQLVKVSQEKADA